MDSVLKAIQNLDTGHRVSSSSPSFQVRNVKLDFPKFDGSDVLQWIFKAEQFFDYYNTPDDQRLIIASVHLEKEVVPWFQMQARNHAFPSWVAFTRALEMSFGPSPYECPHSDLFKLTQSRSVHEYYVKFTALANRVQGITSEALLDYFVGGLRQDIRRDVLVQDPKTLMRCVSLAKLFEEKYAAQHKFYGPKSSPSNPLLPTATHSLKTTALPPLLNKSTPSPPVTKAMIKKLSPAEVQLRREKGLCFTCDEKYSLSHRCPNKQYLWLHLDEEDFATNSTLSDSVSEDNIEPQPPPEPHLSFNALKGSHGLATMRFKGAINGLPVQVLLDSGSSDNFLQPRIAACLKLPVEPIANFKVLVGNGSALVVEGLVNNVQVNIQNHTIQLPTYLLPISGADLVLGASWLATLGAHISDYSNLSLKFMLNDKFVTLRGEQPKLPAPAQFNHFRRMFHTHAIEEMYCLQFHTSRTAHDQFLELPVDMEPKLALLLHTYKEVFAEPRDLTPNRSHTHTIPLLQGSNPVKVRPYRYPFSQKQQIETMVQEMLDTGLIVPSTSPFSSPIILVKKKDGTWRFCTDYRALNAITVKDSFPIPTVDELIDELHGAKIFSKLDLRAGYHQILMQEEDRYKTAFRTHQGLYEWRVMPFGLTNAPATFQALMNNIF